MPTDRLPLSAAVLARARGPNARALLVTLVALVGAACGGREASEPSSASAPPDAGGTSGTRDDAVTANNTADTFARGPRYHEVMGELAKIADRMQCNRVTGCPGLVGLFQFGSELIAPAADAFAAPNRGEGYWQIVLPETLGQLADPRVTPLLVTLLRDRRWEIRIAAAIGLAHLDQHADASALPELKRLAALPDNAPAEGGDLAMRAALELALMRLDDAAAAEHKKTLLGLMPMTAQAVATTPPPILDVLVAIIGHGRLNEALPCVREALGTGNRFVVATALDVAGKLHDNGAIRRVIALCEDRNPTLRRMAFRTLDQITGASFDTVEQWRTWADKLGVPPD